MKKKKLTIKELADTFYSDCPEIKREIAYIKAKNWLWNRYLDELHKAKLKSIKS